MERYSLKNCATEASLIREPIQYANRGINDRNKSDAERKVKNTVHTSVAAATNDSNSGRILSLDGDVDDASASTDSDNYVDDNVSDISDSNCNAAQINRFSVLY